MRLGETIKASGVRSLSNLTEGKLYTVLGYIESRYDESAGYTWPASVIVLDDNNRKGYFHASRFTRKES